MKASTFELIAASVISIVIGWSFCWLNHPEQKPAVESLPTLEYTNAHGTPIEWAEKLYQIIDGEEMALHGVHVTSEVIEWIDGDDITENPPSDLDELAAVDIAWPDIEHIAIAGTKDWKIDLTRCGDLTREEMRDLMIWYTFIKQNAPWCDELVDKSIELMVPPKLIEK